MSHQRLFSRFHKKIKVETEELRDKRDILVEKIRDSLKAAGHPLPVPLNQGSYIYGVGVKPVGDEEYDIDVGLDFPITSTDYEAKDPRKWVYDAIEDHTKSVEDRGPCIRVRYAAGYHVDLVVYARYKDSEETENYQLALKNNSWRSADPKKLKQFIIDSREPFKETKDYSSSDQLQRVTRFLKRWNDLAIPGDSDNKPSGLATLLLVIKYLPTPCLKNGEASDLEALITVASAVNNLFGRISINKPTPEYEDMFQKLSSEAMEILKKRFKNLLKALETAKNQNEEDAVKTLAKEFGEDFEDCLNKNETEDTDDRIHINQKMETAATSFTNPSKPWSK